MLTDGVNTSVFEFDNDNSITAGRERVGFLASDSPQVIAQNLAAAINRVGTLQVAASVTPSSDRVDLTGNSVAPALSLPLNLTVDIAANSVLETTGANATTVTIRREGDTSAALPVSLQVLTNAGRVAVPASRRHSGRSGLGDVPLGDRRQRHCRRDADRRDQRLGRSLDGCQRPGRRALTMKLPN